jgi:hypothetical protein
MAPRFRGGGTAGAPSGVNDNYDDGHRLIIEA